jgi:hypothetical protein
MKKMDNYVYLYNGRTGYIYDILQVVQHINQYVDNKPEKLYELAVQLKLIKKYKHRKTMEDIYLLDVFESMLYGPVGIQLVEGKIIFPDPIKPLIS